MSTEQKYIFELHKYLLERKNYLSNLKTCLKNNDALNMIDTSLTEIRNLENHLDKFLKENSINYFKMKE